VSVAELLRSLDTQAKVFLQMASSNSNATASEADEEAAVSASGFALYLREVYAQVDANLEVTRLFSKARSEEQSAHATASASASAGGGDAMDVDIDDDDAADVKAYAAPVTRGAAKGTLLVVVYTRVLTVVLAAAVDIVVAALLIM
jgi:hypothetical protein